MESLKTRERVILRDHRACAVFMPQDMRLFTLDIPHSVPLARISDWLAEQSKTGVHTAANSDASPAGSSAADEDNVDALSLSYREAILPMMLGVMPLHQAGIKPKINRLTLNISNACNLWCSYCYADHGHYHSPRSYMSVERAKNIVNNVLMAYREVDIVHYFGGEPLLNLAVINAVGEMFAAAHKSGQIEKMPLFVATTNGTLSSPKVIETLRRWGMELTVSWDGPKDIHDTARPTQNKKYSSHDQLLKTLERVRNAGIHYEIECTYNRHHVDAGISVVDLMQYFWGHTGLQSYHIAPVSQPETLKLGNQQQVFRGEALKLMTHNSLPKEAIVPMYREAAAVTVDNMFGGDGPLLSFASSIVEQILSQRKSSIYCPAFFNQLSIATDGSVFPCFMFIGDEQFNLGNILTDQFPTEKSLQVIKRYFEEFGLSPVGTGEWYAPLFSGCVAGEYIASNNLATRSSKSLYEAMIEECLLCVAAYSMEGAAVEHYDRARMC